MYTCGLVSILDGKNPTGFFFCTEGREGTEVQSRVGSKGLEHSPSHSSQQQCGMSLAEIWFSEPKRGHCLCHPPTSGLH
jgi:hypothetical protein